MSVPIDCADHGIQAWERTLDLILHHVHETSSVSAVDVAALLKAFAWAQLVLVQGASTPDLTIIADMQIPAASRLTLAGQTESQMLLSALVLAVTKDALVLADVDSRERDVNGDPGGPSVPKEPQRQATQPTAREWEVLELVKHGKSNKRIAYELALSESTVKIHIRNLMLKRGSMNRTHLAMNADIRQRRPH